MKPSLRYSSYLCTVRTFLFIFLSLIFFQQVYAQGTVLHNHFTGSMGEADREGVQPNCAPNAISNFPADIYINLQVPPVYNGALELSPFYVGVTIYEEDPNNTFHSAPNRSALNNRFPFNNSSTYIFENQPITSFQFKEVVQDPNDNSYIANKYTSGRVIFDISGFSNLHLQYYSDISCLHGGKRSFIEFKLYRKVITGRSSYHYEIHDFKDINITGDYIGEGWVPTTFDVVNQADLWSNFNNLRDWDVLNNYAWFGNNCINVACGSSNQASDNGSNILNGGRRSAHSESSPFDPFLYPNPAQENVNLEFHLKDDHHVQITVYNAFGELVQLKQNKHLYSKGKNNLNIDISNFSKGLYFINLQTGDQEDHTLKFIKQ